MAAIAAGALLSASCVLFPPPPPVTPGFAPAGPNRFGYGGTQSPNYPSSDPRALPGNSGNPGSSSNQPPREIKRDPRDTVVNIDPPPPRNSKPPAEALPPSNPTPPSESGSTVSKPVPREDLPYGIVAVGRKGFVYSPYAEDRGLVDVDGMKRGTRVECPYTKKHFRVP